jgi:hypothetical protein
VDVGVYEPVHFEARATAAAGVVGLSVFAIEIRSQGKCQGQVATTRRATKQLCVRHVALLHSLHKCMLERQKSGDVFE